MHTRFLSQIHLHLQAVADPEDIGLWDGPIMSVYSKEVADWQGKGYGALLSTPSVSLKHFTPLSQKIPLLW